MYRFFVEYQFESGCFIERIISLLEQKYGNIVLQILGFSDVGLLKWGAEALEETFGYFTLSCIGRLKLFDLLPIKVSEHSIGDIRILYYRDS